MNISVYKSKGYNSRNEYLEDLSIEYNIPYDEVCTLADTLGPNEDFDGLLCALSDYELFRN